MKYVITGISRLTGDRVVISKPMEKEMAVQLRKKNLCLTTVTAHSLG
jgi:hypothetical protein